MFFQCVVSVEGTSTLLTDKSLLVLVHARMSDHRTALSMLKLTKFTFEATRSKFYCYVSCIYFLFLSLGFFGTIMAFEKSLILVTLKTNNTCEIFVFSSSW